MPRRQRLDAELVRRGMARSREHAARLIESGRVSVAGAPATKAATGVTTDAALTVAEGEGASGPDYVSRGAVKLAGALDAFEPAGLRVRGRTALDAGASTGGFTDVLLRRGVAAVVAVDVGYGQLAWSLRQDPRVTVVERTNVRDLAAGSLPFAPDLVVGDLSFISLTVVLPALVRVAAPGADFALMVKPQFEVGRDRVGKGGVVRSDSARVDAVLRVAAAGAGLGLGVAGCCASPLPGPAGNVEYFLWLRPGAPPVDEAGVRTVVSDGPG
jgi:23S rRNA (cytidine1920-2'-O)/16S rRNA (cytidine1409-2'-O)-methyltransferase